MLAPAIVVNKYILFKKQIYKDYITVKTGVQKGKAGV